MLGNVTFRTFTFVIMISILSNTALAQEEASQQSRNEVGLIVLLIGIVAVGLVGGIILLRQQREEDNRQSG